MKKSSSLFDSFRRLLDDVDHLFVEADQGLEDAELQESRLTEEFSTFMGSKSSFYVADTSEKDLFCRVRRTDNGWEVALKFKAPLKDSLSNDGRRLSRLVSKLVKVFSYGPFATDINDDEGAAK